MKEILLGVCAAMSVVAFLAMGVDKRRAKMKQYRIPEKTLFLLALLMGGIGGTAGMWLFRHKTRHIQFAIGFPLIAAVQLVILALVWLKA